MSSSGSLLFGTDDVSKYPVLFRQTAEELVGWRGSVPEQQASREARGAALRPVSPQQARPIPHTLCSIFGEHKFSLLPVKYSYCVHMCVQICVHVCVCRPVCTRVPICVSIWVHVCMHNCVCAPCKGKEKRKQRETRVLKKHVFLWLVAPLLKLLSQDKLHLKEILFVIEVEACFEDSA